MRKTYILSCLCLLGALLLWSCAKEGEEPRYRPLEPEIPDSIVVQDTICLKNLEVRVAPGQGLVVSGSAILSESYDSLWAFLDAEYQGEEEGHDFEVVAFGLLRNGETVPHFAQIGGCIGIPDTQWDLDPSNDQGQFERFAGVVMLDAISQPTEYFCAFAHALDVQGSCFTGTASWPNDVGITSVTLVGFRKVPVQ